MLLGFLLDHFQIDFLTFFAVFMKPLLNLIV